MDMQLARRAVRLFPMQPYLTLSGVKHNRRAWMRSVIALGDNWLLATKVKRKGA